MAFFYILLSWFTRLLVSLVLRWAGTLVAKVDAWEQKSVQSLGADASKRTAAATRDLLLVRTAADAIVNEINAASSRLAPQAPTGPPPAVTAAVDVGGMAPKA